MYVSYSSNTVASPLRNRLATCASELVVIFTILRLPMGGKNAFFKVYIIVPFLQCLIIPHAFGNQSSGPTLTH